MRGWDRTRCVTTTRSPRSRRCAGRRAGIGQVLLDQTVIAGFGNVYRAELLFLLRIDPDRAAGTVDRATFDELWRLLRGLLTNGERRGRIITIAPADRSRPPSGLRRDERLYVYKRAGMPADGAAR